MNARFATHILPILLSLFFVVGSIANGFPSAATRADYVAWGSPGWFHFVTAACEITTAILLFFPRTRLWGVLLGLAVMGSAALTLLLHSEFAHMLIPLTIMALLMFAGAAAWPARARNGRAD